MTAFDRATLTRLRALLDKRDALAEQFDATEGRAAQITAALGLDAANRHLRYAAADALPALLDLAEIALAPAVPGHRLPSPAFDAVEHEAA